MYLNILTFGIAALLFIYSFILDKRVKQVKNNGYLVNLVIVLSLLFAFSGVVNLFMFSKYDFIGTFLARILLVLSGWFSILSCNYLLLYPNYKKNKLIILFQAFFFLLAIYMIFFIPNSIIRTVVTKDGRYNFISSLISEEENGLKLPWVVAYNILYRMVIPAFVCLLVLVRSENVESKLVKQNIRINVLGFVFSWLVIEYFQKAGEYQPALSMSAIAGYIVIVYFFTVTTSKDEVWDKNYMLRGTARFVFKFVIPSIVAGLVFIGLWPVASEDKEIFFIAYSVTALILLALSVFVKNKVKNSEFLRDNRYADAFEADITSIEFERSPENVVAYVFKILKKYVTTSSLKIMIDDGNGSLEKVWDSAQKDDEAADEKNQKPLVANTFMFDLFMNNNQQIVFREMVERNSAYLKIKNDVLAFMDKADCDAFIILAEGRQIIGLFLLGKKSSKNVYSNYDLAVFKKFYSNFFVVGYYVKNIMNETVVGTVNREIRMSGQIITSIQENMELINNPKVDTGYLMVPAHNIGGEFVDLIRLTDSRHIFVIGSVSGKGIAASMSMVILKSIIRTFLAETTDFKKLVAKVNAFVRDNLPKGIFFSGTFGLMDFASNTMYYINCGSPAIFVYSKAYNNVIEVQGEGHILGFVKDITPYVKVKKIKLTEGDIVFICTDGLIDSRSLRGDIFSKSRVSTAITENQTYTADRLAKFTYESLKSFTSKELEDDITILVFKYVGGNK